MPIPKLFQQNTFVVNQKAGLFKMANQYQLQDEQQNDIGFVQEVVPGWAKFARFFLNKQLLPFELSIMDENQNLLAKIKRGFTLAMPKVQVFDANEKLIGTFRGKFKLLGVKFEIQDEEGNIVGEINGNWKGWDFTITDQNGNQIGTVNKKWAGAMKEIFTTADRYKVEINPSVAEDENKILMVAVAISIDMILKNGK
ncbi:scramblase [Candidatus Dojkabacteria bacterium]|nr:scramblase [Candidatus Dojkabacteria bacterium]